MVFDVRRDPVAPAAEEERATFWPISDETGPSGAASCAARIMDVGRLRCSFEDDAPLRDRQRPRRRRARRRRRVVEAEPTAVRPRYSVQHASAGALPRRVALRCSQTSRWREKPRSPQTRTSSARCERAGDVRLSPAQKSAAPRRQPTPPPPPKRQRHRWRRRSGRRRRP